MISIKNTFTILLLTSFILSFGGIGLMGNSSITSKDGADTLDGFSLTYQNTNSKENGGSFFIYFDALPKGLALEASVEINTQLLDMEISFSDQDNYFTQFYAARQSAYFTIRKNWKSFSVPLIAKLAVNYGIGYNMHTLILPSVSLLKDINNTTDLNDLYDQSQDNFDLGDINSLFNEYGTNSDGFHIQVGAQFKILTLNAFGIAKYTFLLNKDLNLENFPSVNMGFAYGI